MNSKIKVDKFVIVVLIIQLVMMIMRILQNR